MIIEEKMPITMMQRIANQDVATCISLNAFDLVEANKKGGLKGKLKEIASKLDEG